MKAVIPLAVGLAGGIAFGILIAVYLIPSRTVVEGIQTISDEEIISKSKNLDEVRIFLARFPESHEYVERKGALANVFFVPANGTFSTCTDEFCSDTEILTRFIKVTSDTSIQDSQYTVYCGTATVKSDGTIDQIRAERRPFEEETCTGHSG